MIYEVYIDDSLIFRTGLEPLQLADAEIKKELGKVDSFSFTMYPDHPFYGSIQRLKPIVTVWRDDELLFRGRILDSEDDFEGARKVICEGDLSFLMDSIIRPYDFSSMDTMKPEELIEIFLSSHNGQTDDAKKILPGKVIDIEPNVPLNVSDSNYSTCWDALNSSLIDQIGGYFIARHEIEGNGTITTYLDYRALNTMPKVATPVISVVGESISSGEDSSEAAEYHVGQRIEFGRNLSDFTRTLSGEELVTGIIPLGEDQEDEEGNKMRLTIESVNDGKDYIVDEDAAARFGKIFAVVEFDHVNDASDLLRYAQNYLAEAVNEAIEIEISAVDLSLLDSSIEAFHEGDWVEVVSQPHGIDSLYLVSKLSISLIDASSSRLTLGISGKTLTEQTADQGKSFGFLSQNLQNRVGAIEDSTKITDRHFAELTDDWSEASGLGRAGYYKTPAGQIYLFGTITGGDEINETDAFTLPEGYRPSEKVVFSAQRDVTIDTDGTVSIEGGVLNANVSLGSICFLVG